MTDEDPQETHDEENRNQCKSNILRVFSLDIIARSFSCESSCLQAIAWQILEELSITYINE